MWNSGIYCCYCLLLFEETRSMEQTGLFVVRVNVLWSAQQKHSKSRTHVHLYLQLRLCGKQPTADLLLDTQSSNNVTRQTDQSDVTSIYWCCVLFWYDIFVNTFAASYLNTQGLNNSCLKSPASTLVDLTFQSRALRSFSLHQLRNLSL